MTRSNVQLGGQELKLDADADTSITADTDDQIDIRIGGSDKITINSSGRVGIGTTDIDAPLDIVDSTTEYIRIAQRTDDNETKTGGLVIRHRTNSEEDFNIINGVSGNTASIVNIGGSDFIGNINCATQIAFFTGANTTTLNGTSRMTIASNGAVAVAGALSKGSGSFKIDHPLESKKDTHHLVHSFIEGPQADLIYRGKATLSSGTATVNIDTVNGMTSGTFVALNTNVQCFTNNESGWTAVKGSVSGNTLTITAQDNSCTDTISWMVIGERQDPHMKDSETDWTDSDGKVIVEPKKGSD